MDKNTAIVWTPIGSQTGKYQGTFEGNGHTISGLYFGSNDLGEGSSAGSEEGSYVGLFGSVGSNGRVSHVGVDMSVQKSQAVTMLELCAVLTMQMKVRT